MYDYLQSITFGVSDIVLVKISRYLWFMTFLWGLNMSFTVLLLMDKRNDL